ncbi:hypothetical protein AB6D20_013920 [Vibrio splendidus]|jgi:hypothetical protein|uniref:hypothetical protein n=1 Tax=Vibrio splendidus TaxID=29497 RepID=UPI0002FB6F14|nr:hypothetical protein [Vibrio splendidus]
MKESGHLFRFLAFWNWVFLFDMVKSTVVSLKRAALVARDVLFRLIIKLVYVQAEQ